MKKDYEIKVEGKKWEDALTKSFNKRKNEVNVPGFRKGKVTKEVYIKQFGVESLFMDAIDFVLDGAYKDLLEKESVIPAASPSVDVKSVTEKEAIVVFTIVTKPEVKLGKYKALGIKKEEIKVTKEEIEHQIEHLKEKYIELKIKDGKIENKNIAVIDFEGFKDGVAFDGGKGEEYPLEIGSNTFIPGFEEQLIGLKKDDQKDVIVSFPNDYPSEDLKGKEVTFKVKIREVKEKVMPEIGKEFFEDLAMEGVNSIETLEKEVENNIKTQKQVEAENGYIDQVLETVSKNATFELPEEMVNDEIERMINEFSQNLKMQGFELDQYLQMIRSDIETLKSQMKEEATKRVSYRLVLEQITIEEKIEITDEEAEKESEELAKKYNMKKEEFLKAFGGIEFVKYDMQVRKALDLIQK